MEKISLENFTIARSKIVNERQHLLSIAVERINAERKGTKWKEISPRAVAIKTAHIPLPDLRDFIYQCEKQPEFGRCFFGRLKVKSQSK